VDFVFRYVAVVGPELNKIVLMGTIVIHFKINMLKNRIVKQANVREGCKKAFILLFFWRIFEKMNGR
jgi:hypothetical protein